MHHPVPPEVPMLDSTAHGDGKPVPDSPPPLRAAPAPQSGPPTFTDDSLQVGVTPIRAIHISELHTWIDALRQRRGYSPYSWQYSVTINDFISANPIIEMRTALDEVLGTPSTRYAGGLAQYQPV